MGIDLKFRYFNEACNSNKLFGKKLFSLNRERLIRENYFS